MSIPEAEQRKLFARSGNRCAFPDCRRLLTADGSPPDRLVVLGEVEILDRLQTVFYIEPINGAIRVLGLEQERANDDCRIEVPGRR